MKILHWNIHGWADSDGVDNVERVTDFIKESDPDVVSLVEVDEQWGRPSKLEHVANTLGYHWAFIPAFEYRQQGGFGNALLSRSPFRSVHQRQLLPPSLYDGSEPSEPRAVLLAEVAGEQGSIMIGSTHFPRSNEELRKHASEQLLRLLDELDQPYAICGDFNQTATAWLDESTDVVPVSPTPTYPTNAPDEPIDYVLVNGFGVESSAINRATNASDHLPLRSVLVER